MTRFLSFFQKMRNSLLALVGIVIGAQGAGTSVKKPQPALPERLAAVRTRLNEIQKNPSPTEKAVQSKDLKSNEMSSMGQWGNGWVNWNNWNNWSNWAAWNNWGNFGNWLN